MLMLVLSYNSTNIYMNIRNILLFSILLTTYFLITTACNAEDIFKPKLGVILPLTGKASTAGEAVRNGLTMSNEAKNNYFDLIFEDNALDSTQSLNAANKLIKEDKVNALIVYASGPSNVVSPVAEAASIPMIGMSVDPKVSKDRKWVMIHWASNKNIADMLFSELKRKNLKKIAVLSTQVQGLLDLENYFLSTANNEGLEIVYSQQVLPNETDFQTQISLIRNKKPDAIFVNLYYGQAGLFANKARHLGLKSQLFSHFIFDDDNELKAANGALEGAFFANTSCGDLSFDNEYKVKFGKRAVLGGIAAYDILTIFHDAFSKANSTPTEIMDYLHNIKDFNGKIGKYSALPSNSFNVPTSIRTIKNNMILHKDQ